MLGRLPGVVLEKLCFADTQNEYTVNLCLCDFSEYSFNYKAVEKYLHYHEKDYYKDLKFEKRMKSYLLGRYAAKMAVSAYTSENDLEDILVTWGIFNHPIVKFDHNNNIQVCITHCDDFGAAVAFPEECPIGIDFELTSFERAMVVENQLTEHERNIEEWCCIPKTDFLILLWTAKEALSKALRIGFTSPIQIYEVDSVKRVNDYYLCKYKNFCQYESTSFTIKNYMFSIAYPSKLKMLVDIPILKDKLGYKFDC